jgi:Fe-S cluster biogenesis protein NfuA
MTKYNDKRMVLKKGIPMLRQIEQVLDDQIRPALASHGGDIEVIDYENKKLYVKLTGGCQGCSSSAATLKDGIEKLIIGQFPEYIEHLVDMTDHASGDKPFM